MSELALRNRQRVRRVNVRLLRSITVSVLEGALGICNYELGLHLVGAREMARLNWQFLHHEGSTDVITFDYGKVGPASRLSQTKEDRIGDRQDACPTVHGEIYVCLNAALTQAGQFRTTWQSELVRYVIHVLLHLRGFDDQQPAARRKMKREENRLLSRLGNQFRFDKLAGAGRRKS
jgi:probable rRNA maturation factor